jgi:hypothetical protein
VPGIAALVPLLRADLRGMNKWLLSLKLVLASE